MGGGVHYPPSGINECKWPGREGGYSNVLLIEEKEVLVGRLKLEMNRENPSQMLRELPATRRWHWYSARPATTGTDSNINNNNYY